MILLLCLFKHSRTDMWNHWQAGASCHSRPRGQINPPLRRSSGSAACDDPVRDVMIGIMFIVQYNRRGVWQPPPDHCHHSSAGFKGSVQTSEKNKRQTQKWQNEVIHCWNNTTLRRCRHYNTCLHHTTKSYIYNVIQVSWNISILSITETYRKSINYEHTVI